MSFTHRQQNNIFEKRKLRIPTGALAQLIRYYDNWRKASKSVRNNGVELQIVEDALLRAIQETVTVNSK